jgi:nucleoside-diphosphate-sugar epimerase
MVQTILGSGGAIGIPLARELKKYGTTVRLVSRIPKPVNGDEELFPANLTVPSEVDKAIAGSSVVYVTVGFPYNLKIWREVWPPFIRSVTEACERHKAKLVFFDNMYMYDKGEVPFMTETARLNPPSKKGSVREEVCKVVRSAADKGAVEALIARAADFYGPENRNSVLQIMVADNLKKGKKAQVFGNPDFVHTYTYTPDAALATAFLGNTPDAYNQVWHLPTTAERITTRTWIELIAKEMGVNAGIQSVPKFMIKLLGVFIPVMREFPEMLYQYDRDYVFDSSKIAKKYGLVSTSPETGVRDFVRSLQF